jgi:GNAT superfamily N-acetyltransferase
MSTERMIRLGTPRDARALAEIHIEGWRAAYQHIFPAEAFAARTVEKREAEWDEYFAEPQDESRVWVSSVAGGVAGFAYTRPGTDADIRAGGELKQFYVRPERKGQGIGLPLFRKAGEDMEARGMTPYLYTLKENHAARAWYEKRGWVADGREAPWSDRGEYPDIKEVRFRPSASA